MLNRLVSFQLVEQTQRPGADGKPKAKNFSEEPQKAARRLQKNRNDIYSLIENEHKDFYQHMETYMHFGVESRYNPPENISWNIL